MQRVFLRSIESDGHLDMTFVKLRLAEEGWSDIFLMKLDDFMDLAAIDSGAPSDEDCKRIIEKSREIIRTDAEEMKKMRLGKAIKHVYNKIDEKLKLNYSDSPILVYAQIILTIYEDFDEFGWAQ